MDKTIKQIADELGLTKQAVRKRIAKLPSSYYYVGDNRTIYVRPEGLKLLEKEVTTKPTNLDTKLVDMLQQQLIEKDEQIKAKDEQISRLLKSLDQAQQLQAIAETKLQAIEDKQQEMETPSRKWPWSRK